MKKLNPNTKLHQVFATLASGTALTQDQARSRLGVANLRAEATRLRQAGYAVNTTRKLDEHNRPVTEYRLGRPSREIVALGYRARALGLSI